jgi:hypothetical protein
MMGIIHSNFELDTHPPCDNPPLACDFAVKPRFWPILAVKFLKNWRKPAIVKNSKVDRQTDKPFVFVLSYGRELGE